MKQIRAFRNRALRKNKKGGIEGLPLQLMIVIVIASLGLAMMVGWMGNIEEPKAIGDIESTVSSSHGLSFNKDSSITLTVSVYDIEGNPVEGADVIVTGLGASQGDNSIFGYKGNKDSTVPHGVTGEDGSVKITLKLHTSVDYGYLNIEVSKTGYSGNSAQVLVTV